MFNEIVVKLLGLVYFVVGNFSVQFSIYVKTANCQSSLVVHWAKDLALSLLWPWSLLWRRLDSWPGNFRMPRVQPQKQKETNQKTADCPIE